MAPKKNYPAATEVQQLEQAGFSPDQIDGLLAFKALYTQGAYYEADPERMRQEFVRWLYLQGRLESEDTVPTLACTRGHPDVAVMGVTDVTLRGNRTRVA